MTISTAVRPALAAVAALGLIAALPEIGLAQFNTLKTIQRAQKNIVKVTRKVSKERNRCARQIETDELAWVIDCRENPTTVQSGSGPGFEIELIDACRCRSRLAAD